MKPINEYTLQDCLNSILKADMILHRHELANRIHDLTRWIPVGERLPTDEDADENGHVSVTAVQEATGKTFIESWSWDWVEDGVWGYTITHWRRIDKPEATP
jgi:hypothetical protein